MAFYSFAKVPKGPFPRDEDLPVSPDIGFEVRSSLDRWRDVIATVNEYSRIGVPVICIVDDAAREVQVFGGNGVATLRGDDELTFSHALPGFRVPVNRLFE